MDAAQEIRAQCARRDLTVQQIALGARVSAGTVERAMHGRPIRPAKARAIVEALFREPRPDLVAGLCLVEEKPRG